MSLHQLLYVSKAVRPMFSEDLRELHAQSARKNQPLSITGILLYSGGHFIQLLEGRKPILERVYLKISQDPRHASVQCLFSRNCRERLFSSWHMGMLNLDEGPELNRIQLMNVLTRYRQFGENAESNSLAIQMLREFRNQLAVKPEDALADSSV